MTQPAEEEMTELYDADIDRVDLVRQGANGVPRFLLAKQAEGARGVMPADAVRDLIGSTEPAQSGREQVTMPSGVTLSGSPTDIAAFIHKAAQRSREREIVTGVDGAVTNERDLADVLQQQHQARAEQVTKAQAAYPDSPREVALSKFVYDRVIKAEKYDAAARKKMAGSGAAMEDGSYPIGDEDDLDKAIRAVGRGGASHNAIRAHIIRRAKALGKSSLIPANWASDGSLKEGSVSKTADVAKADMGPDLDTGAGGLDPTVPLAAPDDDKPGDPADPGSPAWEAIDAATAMKWTSIAVRLKNALCVLSERELLEAASADPDDCENAWDLQDAMCAVDYVISTLAVFAAGEQAQADLGGEAMEMIGKALAAFDTGPLGVIEGLTPVAKAGRTLSAANEELLRQAEANLKQVLATLPAAPSTQDSGQPVAKQEGAAMAPTLTTETSTAGPGGGTAPPARVAKGVPSAEEQARNTTPVGGGTTGMGQPRVTGPAAALPDDGPQAALPGDVPGRQVIKAAAARAVRVYDRGRQLLGVTDASAISTIAKADGDKKAMCVVYGATGKLMGICDPDDITPVANAEASPDDAPSGDDGQGAAAAQDMTPAPAATVGTPADVMAKAATASTGTGGLAAGLQAPAPALDAVLKSVTEAIRDGLETQSAALRETIAKQATVIEEQAGQIGQLTDRVTVVEKHPAMPGVFTNGQLPPEGALPPARPSLRGQDRAPGGGPPKVDMAKAMERRREFNDADPGEQNRLAKEMQTDAIGLLGFIHGRPVPDQQQPAL